jgi:hypothetical protein
MPIGNWLSAEQGKPLLRTVDLGTLRGKRDYATLALLLGCGLRRAELTALRVEDIQQREEHWVIADLIGKGGHIHTIPVPDWVKAGIDTWMTAAGIVDGILLRSINKAGRVWGWGFSPKVTGVWLRRKQRSVRFQLWRPTTSVAPVRACVISREGSWSKSSFFWGTSQCRRPSGTSDANSGSIMRLTIGSGSNRPRRDSRRFRLTCRLVRT